MRQARQINPEFRSMFTMARRMARKYGTIGIHEPDDVAHSALIKLLSRRDEREPTVGWLYKTVRSAAADAARSCGRERPFSSAQLDGSPSCVIEQADELGMVYPNGRHGIADYNEQEFDVIEQLLEMLKQLTEPLREVLLLYASGASYDEIASATGAKIGTVRSRLHYARRRARQLLGSLA